MARGHVAEEERHPGEYPALDDAAMDLLLERNALDVALYAHVEKSLATQRSSAPA